MTISIFVLTACFFYIHDDYPHHRRRRHHHHHHHQFQAFLSWLYPQSRGVLWDFRGGRVWGFGIRIQGLGLGYLRSMYFLSGRIYYSGFRFGGLA